MFIVTLKRHKFSLLLWPPNARKVLNKSSNLWSYIKQQTHYEKSDWSRAFNQFTIACELDMINAISAAAIAFIMSSSTSAWLLRPLECSPQKQNGWMLCFCFPGWITGMWKMYNKTIIEFGFHMILWIEGLRAKRAYIEFWSIFSFWQDRANFWQTDFFWHEKHRSVIVSVNLRFVLQK